MPTSIVRVSEAAERVLIQAVEARLDQLDELIEATHSMIDASQSATDAMALTLFRLEDRLTLLEEWTRIRFQELARDR